MSGINEAQDSHQSLRNLLRQGSSGSQTCKNVHSREPSADFGVPKKAREEGTGNNTQPLCLQSMEPTDGNSAKLGQKLPNQVVAGAARRYNLKQHKSNEPVAHLPPKTLHTLACHDQSAVPEGKPPTLRKRKAESTSRMGKDEIGRSTDAARLKQFNIKSGLINVKNKAGKALHDITGIILNNIKKEVSNSSNTGSTNATGSKPPAQRSNTVNSNFGSRNGSTKVQARMGDQTTIYKKGA